jgi:hypothetical protein
MNAVRQLVHAAGQRQGPTAGVTGLGLDETAFLTATATSATSFVTGIVDLIGTARLLNAVAARSGKAPLRADIRATLPGAIRLPSTRSSRYAATGRAVNQPAAGRAGVGRVPPDPAWVPIVDDVRRRAQLDDQ